MNEIPNDSINSSYSETLAPKSTEIEQAILGALLSNPESFYLMEPTLTPEDFYSHANRLIYGEIVSMINSGQQTDLLTVFDRLRADGKEKESGGLPYLNNLIESSSSSVNLSQYAAILRDKSLKRLLLQTIARLEAEIGQRKTASAVQLIDTVQAEILKINPDEEGKNGFISANQMLDKLTESMLDAVNAPDKIQGAESGIEEFDLLTNGFKPGQLIVLAARPSVGKTAFALQVARYTATVRSLPVAIFSIEMGKEEIIKRLVSAQSRIDISAIESGQLSAPQWRTYYETMEVLKKAALFVDDSGLINLYRLKSKARQLKARLGKLGLIVVDYLQLIDDEGDTESQENRAMKLGALSRGLKLLAKELSCPILLLSQLNRNVENRPSRKPMLSDLRESGAIEQDADMVIFLYSLAKYGLESGDSRTVYIELAKNRNGAVGQTSVIFDGEHQRFEEINAWKRI